MIAQARDSDGQDVKNKIPNDLADKINVFKGSGGIESLKTGLNKLQSLCNQAEQMVDSCYKMKKQEEAMDERMQA